MTTEEHVLTDEDVELIRLAVAEAGYDPEGVVPASGSASGMAGHDPTLLPAVVMWRAMETMAIGTPLCFICSEVASVLLSGEYVDGCLADRRFVEDCGRDRSEP